MANNTSHISDSLAEIGTLAVGHKPGLGETRGLTFRKRQLLVIKGAILYLLCNKGLRHA
jgi:hypothetical protein